MPTVSENQQTRQIGEALIVAELGRRGLTAKPFRRNLQIADNKDHSTAIWFKAIKSESWQFYINKFLDVRIEGDRQVVRGRKLLTDPQGVCIFVQISSNLGGRGDFYIFRQYELQDFFYRTYSGRVKPYDITSFHCAVWPKDLKQHRDRWDVLTAAVR